MHMPGMGKKPTEQCSRTAPGHSSALELGEVAMSFVFRIFQISHLGYLYYFLTGINKWMVDGRIHTERKTGKNRKGGREGRKEEEAGRKRRKKKKETNLAIERVDNLHYFFSDLFSKAIRGPRLGLADACLLPAAEDPRGDARKPTAESDYEAATSAKHSLCQFYNG